MFLKTAWEDLLKKQVSGIDDCDFGDSAGPGRIYCYRKGIINKKRYCLSKNLIAGFDGHTLYFRIMKAELNRYRQDDIKLRKIAKKLIQ
jgi:hypothetical protein